jgi:hypothetical protein
MPQPHDVAHADGSPPPPPPRRRFLSRLSAAVAAFAMTGAAATSTAAAAPGDDDAEPWLKALDRKEHKQLFHSHDTTDGTVLHQAEVWLDLYSG